MAVLSRALYSNLNYNEEKSSDNMKESNEKVYEMDIKDIGSEFKKNC